jgi:hypothetical protein
MKKNREKRFIDSITEIKEDLSSKGEYYNILFKHDPQVRKWDILRDLHESNIIETISKYEDLQKAKFEVLYHLYRDVFATLQKIDKIEIAKLIDLFDQISFHSFSSIETLQLFWEDCKNSCSLNS